MDIYSVVIIFVFAIIALYMKLRKMCIEENKVINKYTKIIEKNKNIKRFEYIDSKDDKTTIT